MCVRTDVAKELNFFITRGVVIMTKSFGKKENEDKHFVKKETIERNLTLLK